MRVQLTVGLIVWCLAQTLNRPVAAQPPQGTPPRDQRPQAQAGTAIIRGRVFAGDTGKPLRRARISLSAPELAGDNRTTSTDADGRYELTGLPAARYTARASRSGYLIVRYGQRRPLEPGKPLQVAEKQVLENVDFSLPRMGLITGRVLDELNEPIEGANVLALRSMYFNGRRQLVPTGGGQVRTDDAGQYRLLGLAPGTYYVRATTRETWTISRNGDKQVMGYAPTYFPGTARVTDARRVTVALGQEASNIDLSLVLGKAAKISGTAFDSHGRPFTNVFVRQEVRGDDFGSFGQVASTTVAADGAFAIPNIPPGEYILAAATRDTSDPDVARLPIVVDSMDIADVSLTGSIGGIVTGQVHSEDGSVPSIPRLRVTILERATGQPDPMIAGAQLSQALIGGDGTFTVKAVFGRSRLRVTLPDDWAVKAVLHDGQDIAEQPIELTSGETLSDVQVILTNRVTTVAGQLIDDKGLPLTDGTVIAFATDSDRWVDGSRFVKATRPDQQGQWQIKGLPPGDYLAVAVETVEEGQWNEPDYLESMRRYGQKFSLTEASSQSVALKLVTPGQP
jgi:carboxypeptidase family protein